MMPIRQLTIRISFACMVLLIWTSLLFLSPACAGNSIGTTPAPTGTLISENVLFRDDFSTYSARWTTKISPKASARIEDESLKLRVVSPGVSVWSVPDFDADLEQYRIRAHVLINDGSADSFFGVILQYQNDNRFYALMISPAGNWIFLQRDHTSWTDLTPTDASPLELDADMKQSYQIEVECRDETFTLIVNDQLVAKVSSEEIPFGNRFGLIVQAGKGYIDASFDDMIVTAVLEES